MSDAAPEDLRALAAPGARVALRHGAWLDVSLDASVISFVWLQAGAGTGAQGAWLTGLVLWLCSAALSQLYSAAVGPGLFARAAALARTLTLWALLAAALSHMLPAVAVDRRWLAAFLAESALGLLIVRVAHRLLLEVGAVAPKTRRILLVGDGEVARFIGRAIGLRYGWLGLSLLGHVCPRAAAAGQDGQRAVLNELRERVARHGADEVIVVGDDCDDELARRIVAELRWQGIRVSLVPSMSPLGAARTSTEVVAGVPVLTLDTTALRPEQRLVKRVVDVAGASALCVALAPLMLALVVLIRLDSPGPALFSQTRVGEGGRTFRVLKFRTMREGADDGARDVVRIVGGRPVHKFPDDPRVTRIGRWLRSTSLDELPQLVNVLRGEMSLVGPRPELPWIVDQYEPWQFLRLAVPPGITGWWQLNGRSELPMHLNTEYDLFYIERYSLLLDLKLLVRTLLVPFYRRGAF